jgi:hypothetical protein
MLPSVPPSSPLVHANDVGPPRRTTPPLSHQQPQTSSSKLLRLPSLLFADVATTRSSDHHLVSAADQARQGFHPCLQLPGADLILAVAISPHPTANNPHLPALYPTATYFCFYHYNFCTRPTLHPALDRETSCGPSGTHLCAIAAWGCPHSPP